ncbi:putative ubiquitin-protein ligase [Trypanosoma theileri]|uniref:HECT-type E3 ubiquitin transferase n=1 Tax=Trypanosoma theileri TaxID=67003 RepID=A0A1X0P347_9TRYP|nr:putative ubiquitin-protein ligase [Trypanosoma theileri]ORC90979.1 putative ubiquitin-protein ligase [Trypanosoma theileri]
MSGAFVFNGKSRSSHLSLSRDHQPSREAILLEARKKRERREKDRQVQQAALCIQRNVRLWISRRILADLSEALFKRIKERPQEAESKSLEQLSWDYTFLHRGMRGKKKKGAISQREQAQIIFQRLLSSIHAGTIHDELMKSRSTLILLLTLVLDEYVKPSLDLEKNDIVEWQSYHLTLLSALSDVAGSVTDRGNIMIQILSFFVQHGTTGTEQILPLLQNLFGLLSASEVKSIIKTVKGQEMLLRAIRSSVHDKPYSLPTAYALDVLLGSSSEENSSILRGEANQALVEIIVEVASEKLSTDLYTQPMAPLGKLVRLIPFFLDTQTSISVGKEVWKKWTKCLSQLTLMASREGELLRAALQDFRHLQNNEIAHHGRYEHITTYLFSTEYGLRLLEETSALALSLSSTTTTTTTRAEGGEGGTGTVGLSTSNENEEEKGSSEYQEEKYVNLDVICSIFAWPLYAFTYSSPEQRIEATTIISKLVHLPGLLQSLWRMYQCCHGSTFGGLTEMKKEALIHEAMTGVPVHLPPPEEAPAELLRMASYKNPVRNLFWDPYPAISTLLFGMLSYFVDATDFLEGLDRKTVMDHNDAIILVLALKGIVHRSHFHGVLSLGNSEAVAEAALSLLSKLHVINEAQSFVAYPSVWITITNPVILQTFDTITREVWMSFVLSERTHGGSSPTASHTDDRIIRYADNDPNDGYQNDEDDKNNNNNNNNNNNISSSSTGSKTMNQLEKGNCPFIRLPQWSGSSMWSRQERCIRLLQNVPFTVPFDVRASVFTSFLLSHEGRYFSSSFRPFLVRRGYVFPDAFDHFCDNPNSPEMFNVRFRDTNNMLEEGYGEGVYREFLVSLCNEGFAAEYGLFRLTDDGYVYPNPFSYEVTGDAKHLRRIEFLGAMMGRALRDGVLQDVPFALHFRNSILGRSNSINNLKSFDKQMYRNLVSLLSLSEEEIESLSLNFTYNVDILGETREVELLRGGRDIPVTKRNCLNYIHLMADFKLNRESARQTKAFQNGLERIVDQSWLRLFDSKEIMKLFGGDAESAINVADWKRHTQYHDAKDVESKPVKLFWKVVESMSSEQRKKLLKFCTSMNRPPLLGFQFLNPPFKIHVVWDAPEQRLPSASTCFSTLKLPPYNDMETAWKKITEAIEETEDFGLT